MAEKNYVLLTGSKNNAGDYLIKYRAKRLLKAFKPEVNLIDFDGWKLLTDEQVETINNSSALILCGGPSIQEGNRLRNRIYPLRKNLDDIKSPMIMMGSGYKGPRGDWKETHEYELANESLEVLQKVNDSGYLSSVRDYHTLNTLHNKGLKNFLMTGCPALYDLDYQNKEFLEPDGIRSIGFSAGVSYHRSNRMQKVTQDIISELKTQTKAEITVYFHHKIDLSHPKQKSFIEWLEKEGVKYEDISGEAEKLIEVYTRNDMHIGFRVHAHIFASSISKPSILINEDGRGKALFKVVGGVNFDGFETLNNSLVAKALSKFGFMDPFNPYPGLAKDVSANVLYETANNYPRLRIVKTNINNHLNIMRSFINQLP